MKSSRVQGVVGWLASVVVLLAALPNGSISPASTSLLCFMTLLLFSAQVIRDVSQNPIAPASRVAAVGAIWFVVMCWLLAQTMEGLPEALLHPFWALAPEGAKGTISADPEGGQFAVMRLTCYALIFWMALRSAANPERSTKFIRAFALFSGALALYGIASRVFGYNLLLDEEERGAVRASFYNRNSYATYAVFGALANIAAYAQIATKDQLGETRFALRDQLEAFFRGNWVYALGALLCLSALAMTASRAGGVAGVIGVLVLIWALRRKTASGRRLLYWIFPAIVLGFVLVVMSGQTLARFDQSGEDLRFVIYPHVIDGILDRPLLGHGADAFLEAFRPYVPIGAGAAEWQFAHNTYLEVAFEFGLPAAALFLGAFAAVGYRLLRGVLTRRRSQSIPSFALACFAAAGFHSFFDFSLQIPGVAACFAWILGIGWAQSFSEAEKAKGRIATRPSTKPHTL